MRRAFVAIALLAAFAASSGCGILRQIPMPDIPSTPVDPPTVPPSVPSAPSPACVGENQTGCYVEPTAGVYRYVCATPWIAGGITLVGTPSDCPAEPKPPDPPVEPPTGQGKPFPSGHPKFTEVAGAKGLLGDAVNAAGLMVLGCALGAADCQWSVPPVEAMDALTAKLRLAGYDAGRYDDDHSGPWAGSDVIAVKAPGSQVWEEWSVFNYGTLPNGKHSTAFAFKAAFILDAPAAPECPPLTRIDLALKQYAQRSVDATPKTTGLEACDALGFMDRRECPMGIEGSAGRPICETKAGPWTWSLDGVPCAWPSCWPLADNPLQYAAPAPGRLTVCGGNGFCASVVLP